MNPPPINPDTPRKPSGCQHLDLLDIDAARAVVVEDVGDIVQVSLDFFIESALPHVPEKDVQRVRERLRRSRNGLHRQFLKAPDVTEGTESKVFAPLKKVFDGIVNALQSKARRPRLKYVHSPGSTPGSERINSTRPDSHLELLIPKSCKGSTSASAWADIPLVMEQKKVMDASTILDNDHKIIWAGQHMLSNDPCRRYAYGITIENEQMKLWQFSRAHVMVSEPFLWRHDPRTLIRVFGGLAFATDAELGYDPTVTRFLEPGTGTIQYKIEVEEEVYVTKKTLTDHKADPICGRATRVWEAYLERDKSKKSVALKDIWLDSDAELEGDLQKRLIEDLKKLPKHPPYEDGEDNEGRRRDTQHPNYPKEAYAIENPAQYFLTVLAHALVKINGVVDDTKQLMMRKNDIPSEKIYRAVPLPARAARATISGSDRLRPVGGTPRAAAHETGNPPKPSSTVKCQRFQPKKHYRIVFREVGTPIHDLTSFKDIFKALSDITRAIHCLFILGYVHRDISTGNILFYMGLGILCDLEFAKHIQTDSSHEVKTGTPHFIAVEIREREYRFIRSSKEPGLDDLDLSPGSSPVLRYNTLHDLESTWWIAVWMLFFKSPLTGISLPSAHNDHMKKCFPEDRYSYGYRYHILTNDLADSLKYLPKSLTFLSNLLERGRRILTMHYSIAEKNRPVEVARWWRVHEHLGRIFDQVEAQCSDVDTLWAAAAATENTGKRPAKTLDDGPDFVGGSSVDADHPRKRHNTGSMPPPSVHKSVRSQFSTKTSSQKPGRRTPPGSIAEPAYHTRSHGPPSGSKRKSKRV